MATRTKRPAQLVLSLLLLASPLCAQPPTPEVYGPPTATPTPAPPPSPAPSAETVPVAAAAELSSSRSDNAKPITSSATSSERDWLASRKPAWQEPTSSGFGAWGVLLGLVVVAGVVWFQMRKFQRRKASGSHPELTVLARSRVGTRSEVVVVEFGGAVMMLGVTESQITCLQTLPENLVDRPAEHGAFEAEQRDLNEQGNPLHAVQFAAHLERGLEESTSPAIELAKLTSDSTHVGGRSKRRHLVDIEGQAAGLAERLQRRESQG